MIPIEVYSKLLTYAEIKMAEELINRDNSFIIEIFETFMTIDKQYDCILMEYCPVL